MNPGAESSPPSRVVVFPPGGAPERLVEAAEAGVVPVLAPADPKRRARWMAVLEGLGSSRPAGPAGRPPGKHHPVIGLDDAGRRAAETIAAATGRPAVAVRALEAVAQLEEDRAVASILLVGLAEVFTAAGLDRLTGRMRRCPWGLLTGRDEEALSFAVAKALLAPPPRRGPFALFDTLAGRFLEDGQAVAVASVSDGLRAGRWGRLVVNAHGESGHVDLGSAVLCGVWGERETRGGRVVHRGCRPPRCKRAAAGTPSVPVRSLHTDELVLLCCNSFSVLPDLCPSSVSGVLAAAEGYPVAVLGVDRPIPLDSWIGPALADPASGRGLAEWAGLLNDIEEHRSGQRPFLLAGDPLGRAERAAVETVTERPGPSGGRPVLRVAGESGGRAFPSVRGVVTVAAELLGSRGRVVDVGAETAALTAHLRELSEGLATAGQLERAAADLLSAQSLPEGVGEQLAVMGQAAAYLNSCLQRAARVLSEITVRGIEDPLLTRFADVATRYGRTWELACAAALEAGLIQEPFEQFLLDGTEPERHEIAGTCARCRCDLRHERWRSPLLFVQRIVVRCPTCGVREVRTPRGPAVELELPPALVPGGTAHFKVIDRAGPSWDPASFVLQVKDNGRDRVVPVAAGALDGPETERAVEVPLDGAPEVHTVRLAVIRRLDVTYLRHRLPLLGALGGRPADPAPGRVHPRRPPNA